MYSAVIQQLAQSPVQAPATSSVWEMAGVIAAVGAVGGVVNALLSSGNGYSIQWPKDNGDILQLGVLGNVLLGAFAALITWGLYGPLKDAALLGSTPTGGLPVNLTVTAVVGAAVAGAGGARVVSNALDKQVLRVTAAKAAQEPPNPQLALAVATLPPVQALAAAKDQAAENQVPTAQAPPTVQAAKEQTATEQATGSPVRDGLNGPGSDEAVDRGPQETVGAGAPH